MLQPAPPDLVAHSPLPESSWWGQDSCLPPLPHRLWESRSGAAPHSVPCPPCPGQCQCWGTGRPPVHPALAGAQWVAGPALGSRLLQATPQLPAPKPNNCGSRNTRPTLVPSEAGCLQALETASRGGCLWPLEAALCTADMKLGPPALSWEQPGLGPLGGPLGGDMHQAETTDWPGGPCPVKGPLQTPRPASRHPGAAADPVHAALALVSQDGFVGTSGAFVWVPWSRSFSGVAEAAQGAVLRQWPLRIWAHGPLRVADLSLPLWGPRGCTRGRGAELALLPVTPGGLCSCREPSAQ